MNKRRNGFSIWYATSIVILLIILTISIDIVVRLILINSSINISNPWIRSFINVTSQILIINYTYKKNYINLKELFKFRNINILIIVSIVLITIGSKIIFSEVGTLIRGIFPESKDIYFYKQNIFGGNITLLGSVVATVIFAPIFEELLFRGVLVQGLITKYTSKVAILVSSILFSLFHFDIYVLIPAFFMGLFLGWLVIEFDSIIPCIFAHSLYNGFPRLLKYVFNVNIDIKANIHYQALWFNIIGISCLALGISILIYSLRNTHKIK